MLKDAVVSIARRPDRPLRLALAPLVFGAAISITATTAAAQDRAVEIRALSGGFIATGDLRHDVTDAGFYGGQVAWQFHPNWAAVGTFGWAPTGSRTLAPNRHVDAYQYDLGLEGRLPAVTTLAGTDVGLFLGTGFGGRTYQVRNDGGSDTQFDGFGSIGVDLSTASSPLVFRTEARDYLSSYQGLNGTLTSTKTRNDVAVFAGFGYRFR